MGERKVQLSVSSRGLLVFDGARVQELHSPEACFLVIFAPCHWFFEAIREKRTNIAPVLLDQFSKQYHDDFMGENR